MDVVLPDHAVSGQIDDDEVLLFSLKRELA
jgi:hypothetical protein